MGKLLTWNQVHSCVLVADTRYGNEVWLLDQVTATRSQLLFCKAIVSVTLTGSLGPLFLLQGC
jgi:hypothetical protein